MRAGDVRMYMYIRHTTVVSAAVLASALACRSSDLFSVPVPPNVIAGGQLTDSAGGEALRRGAISTLATAFAGVEQALFSEGLLSDELSQTSANLYSQAEARTLLGGGPSPFDAPYTELQKARVQAQQAAGVMASHGALPGELGEVYAVIGYADILLAEAMCDGVPLTDVTVSGQLTYGEPLSTDSLLTRALTAFDSAQAHTGGVAQVTALAAVGQGRALVDLGNYAAATTAVAAVPATFTYGLTSFPADDYSWLAFGEGTVADFKGVNGLGYVSLRDARLPVVTNPFCSGTGFVGACYFPAKYPFSQTQSDTVALADGVEAGLIQAEAALARGDTSGWLSALNTLRAEFSSLRGPYAADSNYAPLAPLSDPGTDSARVSLLFQERALWLWGTNHRLGDMRRLVRQYGRDQSVVFSRGPTPTPLNRVFQSYGSDVNFPIPVTEKANPHYRGCLDRNA